MCCVPQLQVRPSVMLGPFPLPRLSETSIPGMQAQPRARGFIYCHELGDNVSA